MKLAMVINHILTEQDNYSTIRLAHKAIERGHVVALVGLGDFTYEMDGSISALASIPRQPEYESDADLQAEDRKPGEVCLTDMDVILLRSDPADEVHARPWASNLRLLSAQYAVDAGVIVLNDPTHLTDASTKNLFSTVS